MLGFHLLLYSDLKVLVFHGLRFRVPLVFRLCKRVMVRSCCAGFQAILQLFLQLCAEGLRGGGRISLGFFSSVPPPLLAAAW